MGESLFMLEMPGAVMVTVPGGGAGDSAHAGARGEFVVFRER